MPAVTVRAMTDEDAGWADRLLSGYQGTRMTARLGELLDPLELRGLVAEVGGSPVGLLTYQVVDDQMEALTVHAQASGHGAGSALLAAAVDEARRLEARRLWLVTTNDNLHAIRFYLRRGMHVARVRKGAVNRDRTLKPQMARVNGENGIPMRDLVEFELDPAAWEPGTTEFPEMRDLNLLPPEAAQAQLAPLFEGAPRFVARLLVARPFEGDDDFIGGARRIARELPDDEAVELVNAHPRIGADASSLSPMSKAEQGSTEQPIAEEDDSQDTGDEPWVAEELAILNDAYERIFGFRFAVFVAGRPKTDIIPLVEAGLRNDREAELRRAVDDCVGIAADRLWKMRSTRLQPEPVQEHA
jgi:2-oxo-4-hydroxy-4-carboxy--5-ureidoimidazoline (OHCU) decarboxylase/GNAT superfamily N-acetyltransferase